MPHRRTNRERWRRFGLAWRSPFVRYRCAEHANAESSESARFLCPARGAARAPVGLVGFRLSYRALVLWRDGPRVRRLGDLVPDGGAGRDAAAPPVPAPALD